MSEYILEMKGITKDFFGVKAIDGLDLAVKPGECVGLCGENGAGKSTLMKVLSAVYPHGTWQGTIMWEGKELKAASIRETEDAGIVIIHQELMMIPRLSVAENIFLGREPLLPGGFIDYPRIYAESERLLKELGMSQINVALPVMNYGGGQQQLVEIAKALSKKAKLLILDEPSSALSEKEVEILLRIVRDLKRRGIACVYISHKLDEVKAIADSVEVIRDGKRIDQKPMSELDVPKIITMMVGREIKNLFPRDPEPRTIGDVVFEAKNFTCWDINNAERKVVDNVSFQVRAGEIVGIAGLVGAGRTETVSAIFGSYPGRYEGEVWLDGKKIAIKAPADAVSQGICMVPEDRKAHGIIPGMSVANNITMSILERFAKFGLVDHEAELVTVNESMQRLRVKAATPFIPVASLSGGNQQKVVLSKMLLPHPKVLILDEPTRGVDVGAKFEIYKLILELARDGIAVIMVSSELPEVLGVSDRVLVIGEGELRGDFKNENLTQEMILSAAIGNAAAAA
jgi:D-xylose transport system ATP-binding protein